MMKLNLYVLMKGEYSFSPLQYKLFLVFPSIKTRVKNTINSLMNMMNIGYP